jgi:hypothetical protein
LPGAEKFCGEVSFDHLNHRHRHCFPPLYGHDAYTATMRRGCTITGGPFYGNGLPSPAVSLVNARARTPRGMSAFGGKADIAIEVKFSTFD